jgi:hypothetical protein
MNYLKIKDNEKLVRDVNTKSIISTDFEGYQQYVEAYKQKQTEIVRITKLENDMDNIKTDLGEIKTLLLGLFKNEPK